MWGLEKKKKKTGFSHGAQYSCQCGFFDRTPGAYGSIRVCHSKNAAVADTLGDEAEHSAAIPASSKSISGPSRLPQQENWNC